MKILFVQLRLESNMAVMMLSSFLKNKGHETDVIIIESESDYIAKIKNDLKPDVIGFSSATVDIKKLVKINRALKAECRFFSVFGGPHPTFFPELIEEEPSIDAICVGEGEGAMAELLSRLQNGEPVGDIQNLHLRQKDGTIVRNSLRPLVENLDSMPFMDKHIYDRYYHHKYLLENVPIRFLASRGCPFKCTYCFNHKFFELYGIKGNQIRKRSVDSLIAEIKVMVEDFNIPMVSFVDDLFCIPREWVKEFAEKYKDEIGLPYSVNTRPNTINEEVAFQLASSGCYYVTFSIESGDEYLRNSVLKRNIGEKEILNAANLLHKYKINFCTGNMLGVPGESLDTIKATVDINRRCAPHYAWASLFQPFPRLELTKYAMDRGYFDGNFDLIGDDQFTDSPLRLIDKKKIVRFHKFFAVVVKYPRFEKFVMLLINLPLDGLYNWMFKKYKIRLNKALVTASWDAMDRQCKESFLSVLGFYLKDIFSDIGQRIPKIKNGKVS
ncbi:MAG TPA: radical SAM protein [Candidatus Omnitrophota bacterium]|nr:radical SAM protein [Candidatus Omnitrophota bacterium]